MREEPIRVLCVFSTLDRGGAESMCMNLYRNIDREKVQFDFIKHTSAKGAFEDEIISLGGRIFTAPRFRVYNLASYRNWWKKHLQLHREHRIIHCHFFTMASAIAPVSRKNGCKLIAHAHTSKSDSLIKTILISRIEKDADYCFSCSHDAGEWLFPNRDFIVFNNAIDAQSFAFDPVMREKYRKELKLEDSLVLGTVANLSPVKNPFGLIDIFNAVHARNTRAKLLWVGDGGLRKDIEQKLLELGLSDSVILTGARNDVPALLKAMDCFLLPSLNEGLPVSLIEAQAAGLPCFVSDTVTKEADVTGLCRFLPLEAPEVWAEAILSDQTPRENTAQKIIDAGYDIRTTAKWLQDFYLDIAQSSN